MTLRLLFVSTPVGAIGSGVGGGVELTLINLAHSLIQRGHQVQVLAPSGSSSSNLPIISVAGQLQIPAQHQGRATPVQMPDNSVLANMWADARQRQAEFDLIINFAYDWLPLYLTPFFQTPIAHLISMGSLTDAMDQIIAQVTTQFPNTIGVHTHSQAQTFDCADQCYILGNGLDLSLYQFCAKPSAGLAWLGRIAPEKALEDAVLATVQSGLSLQVLGHLQDQKYFEQILAQAPQGTVDYLGFLPTDQMQAIVRQCRALLVTPRWVEAFGNVVIEALACGVPVIAYRRGGPAEIIREGETGWLVEPDSVAGLVDAIAKLPQINRHACRQQAEQEYSLEALGDRAEQWFANILRDRG
ncbi:MAG: glycosyltransferase family 4 protein [Thermosynechococcaceae cyanobacterium]